MTEQTPPVPNDNIPHVPTSWAFRIPAWIILLCVWLWALSEAFDLMNAPNDGAFIAGSLLAVCLAGGGIFAGIRIFNYCQRQFHNKQQ
jgi:hypothetical protein